MVQESRLVLPVTLQASVGPSDLLSFKTHYVDCISIMLVEQSAH